MRWLTYLRVSSVTWLAPVMAIAVVFLDTGAGHAGEEYGLAVLAARLQVVGFIAPLAALAAAWDGNYLRRSGALDQPRARSVGAIILRPSTICLVPPLLILLVNVVANSGLQVVLDHLVVVIVTCLALVGWTIFAYGLGLWLHPAISLPLSLATPFWWILGTAALEPLWLRHLGASWEGCCAISTVIAPGALLGTGIIGLALIFSGFLQIWWSSTASRGSRRNIFGWLVALVPVLLGGVLGATQVDQLDVSPTVQRTAGLHCVSGDPEVCIFEEHLARGEEFQALAAAAAAGWRNQGISVPESYRADRSDNDLSEASFQPRLGWEPSAIIGEFARGISWRAACAPDLYDGVMFSTEDFVRIWLQLIAGVDSATIAKYFSAEAVLSVSEFRQNISATEQSRIINEYLSYGNSCLSEGH